MAKKRTPEERAERTEKFARFLHESTLTLLQANPTEGAALHFPNAWRVPWNELPEVAQEHWRTFAPRLAHVYGRLNYYQYRRKDSEVDATRAELWRLTAEAMSPVALVEGETRNER